MYRFHHYGEAVTYIWSLRQRRKRPHEAYSLVYFSRGVAGTECCRPVSSLDDITDFEAELANKIAQNDRARASQKTFYLTEYPEIERMKEVFGNVKAHRLSELLKAFRLDGGAGIKQEIPKRVFYRGLKELRALGLIK